MNSTACMTVRLGECGSRHVVTVFVKKVTKRKRYWTDGWNLSSRRPTRITPMNPPKDLKAKMVATSLISTPMRSLRSSRVGPLTESAIPHAT